MAMSVITRWYYLCLAPKTRKKHRGIKAWLRQCGSDEDTKLVTEVRRLQLRMAHTFLNVLLGPLTHEPPKRCRQDDDYFGTISWKVMLLFHFLFAISGCGVRFLVWTWGCDFFEGHTIRFWCVWRRFDPMMGGWFWWKPWNSSPFFLDPMATRRMKRGQGIFAAFIALEAGQLQVIQQKWARTHLQKKTAIRNDPISRGIAKFINLYWEMVYGSGYRTSKTNSHRWWNCQVGWDWKWYHADLSERPGADFAEELQMTRWLCDLFAKISPKNLQVYDLED